MSWLMLVLGLLLVLGTAFFVAVEFSLVALDSTSVKKAIDGVPGGCDGGRDPVVDDSG